MVKIQECIDMFWGVTVDSGKKYSQTVKQAFHVSMAALDRNGKKNAENIQVMLQHDTSEFLLCTLNDQTLQQSLDLNFETGEEIAFSLNGSGVVHLTGYLALGDDEFEGESYSGSDEDIPNLVDTPDTSAIAVGTKRKKSSAGSTPKKAKLSTSDMLDEADSEDDEDFSDDFDDDEFPDEDHSDMDSEDDDEDEEEEEEDDSDEGEEEASKPVQKVKTPKSEKPAQKVNKESKSTPKQTKKEMKSQQNTPTTPASSKPETPSTAENGESSKKKKKKRKKNKNKDADSSLNDSTASSPAQTPKTETTPKKRVVSGGTIVEDLKIGHGPDAKPGKMVSVYYVGKLAKNQKQFDSCQGGKPFRFRLNQGEVIKGWDNGVNGMKVGGKRRITVPANQGYGNVKQGPIPPNSTLVFEVELKAVN